ncbi:uncharacterized protein N0V89_005749 [Didymosphaeria variabile]|uniref:Uncharacterized protein n=1 Tax=Didymosphaeria variabile TaxID=1932322 RepID=A0A9W8XP39_9PLEO|nr:uncharacterized protein N0V89_005749 [Didymosphaeria variabile]KAJ4354017.1 hypothetical protein N0V89_005749 [Didymosphaeria variabile]
MSTLTGAVVDPTNIERSTYGLAEASLLRPRGKGDVIEIYLRKGLKGQYYHYTAANTDDRVCRTVLRLVGEHFLSVRQKRPDGHGHVRCHYFAEPDCGNSFGELTKVDLWEQPDLEKEPRTVGNDVVGNWKDTIGSVQCFWIRERDIGKQGTGKAGTFLEPINAQEGVPETSNEPALSNRTPIEKELEIRGPSTHDNDRLTEVYNDAQYRGSPIAWATQRDAEREYCIPVKYPDDNCNSHFNPKGEFQAFYLQRDESIYNFWKPVKSMKCNYADPGGRRGN